MNSQNLAARALREGTTSESNAGFGVEGNLAWDETLREENDFRLPVGEGEILKPNVRSA